MAWPRVWLLVVNPIIFLFGCTSSSHARREHIPHPTAEGRNERIRKESRIPASAMQQTGVDVICCLQQQDPMHIMHGISELAFSRGPTEKPDSAAAKAGRRGEHLLAGQDGERTVVRWASGLKAWAARVLLPLTRRVGQRSDSASSGLWHPSCATRG